MTVEHNGHPEKQRAIARRFHALRWQEVYLHAGGTRAKKLPTAVPPGAVGLSKFDAMFLNPAFFRAHGLQLPDTAWLGPPLDAYPSVEF